MNKRLIAFLSILSLSISLPVIPAHSMENGFDAPLDGRTVPIIVSNLGINCTGFLFTERIVLTAGHCLYDMPTKKLVKNVSIGAPNEVFTPNSKRTEVIKSFTSSNWGNFGWSDDVNFNPTGEFGIYVSKEPIKVSGRAVIATPEKVKELTDLRALVTNVAYGDQGPEDRRNGFPSRAPKYARFPLVPYETVKLSIDGALRNFGKKKYNMTIHVLQVPGGPSSCSGDSGSPIYVKENDTFVYLGALSNGLGGAPNCSGKPWADTKMYLGSVDPFDYLDLVSQAEKFVADNPYVEPKVTNSSSNKKTTITCIKGKASTKVTAINPKCPVGYKKK